MLSHPGGGDGSDGSGVVVKTHDAGSWELGRQEVPQPHEGFILRVSPRLLPVAVQPVDGHNAARGSVVSWLRSTIQLLGGHSGTRTLGALPEC